MIAFEQHGGVSYLLNHMCVSLSGNFRDNLFALVAFSNADFELDQLVMSEGDIKFSEHRLSDSLLPDSYHRLQVMAQGHQVLQLFFVWCHRLLTHPLRLTNHTLLLPVHPLPGRAESVHGSIA